MNDVILGKTVAEFAAAVFAVGAAWHWFKSAAVNFLAPGKYWDRIPETDPWLIASQKSACFNKIAATFAGLSALLSALALGIGLA